MARAIAVLQDGGLEVRSLQDYYSRFLSMIPHNSAEIRRCSRSVAAMRVLTKGTSEMATVDKLPMLAEGYEKLQADVRHLKTVERPAIIDAIEEARGHGDLSENAEYHAAKERQGQVEAQIADIEDRLSRAMVIDPKTLSRRQGRSSAPPSTCSTRTTRRSNIRSSARPRRTPRSGGSATPRRSAAR